MENLKLKFWKNHLKYILLSSFLIASLFNVSKLIISLRQERFGRFVDAGMGEFWYQYISHILFCLLVFVIIIFFLPKNQKTAKYFSYRNVIFLIVILMILVFISIKIHRSFFYSPKLIISFGYLARYSMSMALIVLIHRILMLAEESRSKQAKIHQLEIDKIEAQHNQLKKQINPHFFFNTLNSLSGLVKQDADKAVDYISYLSKIFRQSLSNRADLVSLKSEIEFLDYYIKLQKLRFDEAFKVDMELSFGSYNKKVLSMGMQTLLENALKHNTLSKQYPLQIQIFTEDNYVWVSNNYQPRQQSANGENFGLSSLQKRSQWIQQRDIIIKKTEAEFCVGLPLT